MSLTKNMHKYQRCVCLASRHYNTESASTSTTTSTSSEGAKEKMSTVSQLRSLTSGQLKALNQFRKHITRSAYEQGMTMAVNKEWIRMIQRLPSMLAGDQVSASKSETKIESTAQTDSTENNSNAVNGTSTEGGTTTFGYNIPQVFSGFKLNFSTTSKLNAEAASQQSAVPQWKVRKASVVSKEIVATRTRHVVASIAAAESIPSRLKRLEDLMEHLSLHPQSKGFVVKSGGINYLLRLRRDTTNQDTLSVLRETLAMLGHIEPLPGRGIRILSMDGGGTRGVIVIELLRILEGLTGRRVCEMFDYICGVSTGAIMACLFGPLKKNLHDCSMLYKEISAEIFTQSPIWGTGNLLWSHSYYDTAKWEQLLRTYIGEIPLIKTARDPACPKLAVVSAVVNQANVKPHVFRNYELPYRVPASYIGSSRHELWQAVRASAAAPSYFEEFRLGDLLHQDGGILVNNPCAVAIHEAKLLWPGEQIQCVVSFGTGRQHPVELSSQGNVTNGDNSTSSWKTKFSKILDSATDTEAVHTMLHDLLPHDVYFRINPYISDMAGMNEIRAEKLEQLEREAKMYARRNDDKLQQVAAALTQPRTTVQKGQDWLKLQGALMKNK